MPARMRVAAGASLTSSPWNEDARASPDAFLVRRSEAAVLYP